MSKALRLPTILVVTENPSVRFWVKKHLDESFFVLTAESKQEALDAMNTRLDFLIVDSSLEETDALELCGLLSKETKKSVPIFLITGSLKKSYRDQARKLGVSEFLSDQLDENELKSSIESGKKAAAVRQKTEDFALSIPTTIVTSTSLKNKFVLDAAGLRFLAKAKREKTPTALLLLRGDQKEPLAPFVATLIRSQDLLLPAAEGNLILLLSNVDQELAKQMAEQIREQIQKQLHLSVSIAVTALEASEKGFHKMLASAGKSLKAHSESNLIITLDQESSDAP